MNETIEDVVSAMRQDIANGVVGMWADFGGEIARGYVDRIEAAHKREVEELKARLEAVVKECETEKFKWIPAMEYESIVKRSSMVDRYDRILRIARGEVGEMIGRESACHQPVTDCNHLGNAAKMREALSDACYAMHNFLKTKYGGYEEMAKALDKAKAALANPPRNCDIYDEESCRMAYHLKGDGLMTMQAFADWLFAPAEEGGAK